ncbi:MAG TPA: hypothetical protein VMD91_07505 [Candidatus Sulfotelmatobacter sp.]|nr:hypothetical protein [Candidatus Sulfotelmatobacter sp.]
MTCEVTLRDFRSIARIVNLAHRFNCRCTRIDASADAQATKASFDFDGPTAALTRLRAQIDRILAYEIDEVAG